MSNEFQFDVFLSHSSKDKAVVRPLAERLRADGLKVWFDEWVLKPGDSIPAKIEEGLEQSRVLVLCMSAHAFGSDWAQLEAGTFRFRDPLNKERRFIPLRLDDAPIKGSLVQFLYINWRARDREQEYAKLLKASQPSAGVRGSARPGQQPEEFDGVIATLVTQKDQPALPLSPVQSGTRAEPERIECTLNCKDRTFSVLHMRPASMIVRICQAFPMTEFRIIRNSVTKGTPREEVDPKSILALAFAGFEHGEVVEVEIRGLCKRMAGQFFKKAWENLGNYADNVDASKARIAVLIDEVFLGIDESDIEHPGSMPSVVMAHKATPTDECRSLAIINDPLHNLTLAMVPLVARFFDCQLQIAFEHPELGIFLFTMKPEEGFRLDDRIMDLQVQVGTRVTILTRGANRFKANAAIKAILETLGECNVWLQNRAGGLETDATVSELIQHAEGLQGRFSSEFNYVQNPFLGNLLSERHVFVNPSGCELLKKEVLEQLAAPHAQLHRLDMRSLLNTLGETELKEPIIPREGFAIAHAAVPARPLISITFGTYPSGIVWTADGKRVFLVAMVVFSRGNYEVWRDYLKKMAIVFRENQGLREQLVWSSTSQEFLTRLRQAERLAIKKRS